MIPLEDWLRAIDVRPSSPWHRPSTDADDEGSKSHGIGGDDAQTEHVYVKLRGKRPADEEPSAKTRKTVRPSWREEGPVSIGGSTQPQRRQMVLSDMFDDDEPEVAPPPSIEAPPLAVPTGAETRERR